MREVARNYATSHVSTILYTLGITEHSHGVDNVRSLANLAMLTGHIGKRSSGVNPLRGQNNVQGACDMGALPNVYPGYQVVTDMANQEKFQRAWGVPLSSKVGKMIPEMMDGLIAGSIKGMYIFGENSVESDPDIHHVRKALTSAGISGGAGNISHQDRGTGPRGIARERHGRRWKGPIPIRSEGSANPKGRGTPGSGQAQLDDPVGNRPKAGLAQHDLFFR